jgi:hypothetical protein
LIDAVTGELERGVGELFEARRTWTSKLVRQSQHVALLERCGERGLGVQSERPQTLEVWRAFERTEHHSRLGSIEAVEIGPLGAPWVIEVLILEADLLGGIE